MSKWMWEKPQYLEYYRLPAKVIPSQGGEPVVWRFDSSTGGWRSDDDAIVEIESNTQAEVFDLDRDRFIELTESFRARYRLGEGPISALYETIEAVENQAKSENRRLTDSERAMIKGIRHKTYEMFERDLARQGHAGADLFPDS